MSQVATNKGGPDAAARALLPGPSNRLILSLLSGVESDVDWALRDLLKYSAHNTERLTLSVWVHAVDALLTWPHRLIEQAQSTRRYGEAGWELRGEAVEATQRRASESLIILRNAGFNEKANGKLLGSSSRLADFLEAFFALDSDLLLDHLAEQALLVLDILDALMASSTFKLRSASVIPTALVPLFRSRDRAMLLAASRITLGLTSPTYSRASILPSSHPLVAPALESALHLLLLPKTPADRLLRTVALDLIYQHTADPVDAARNILRRSDVGPIIRLLAQGLYDDATRSVQPVFLHPRDRIGIIDVRFRPLLAGPVDPDEWLPSPQELDLLTMMPEPDRCTRWITRSFKRDPLGKITQTAFWSAYRFAFTDRAAQLGGPQLMNASEVIKIVSEIVPGASASVEANPENPSAKVFLIKGIRERKPFPTEPEPNPLLSASFPRLHARTGPQTQAAEGNALTCALTLRNLSRAVIDLLDLHDEDDGGDGDDVTTGEKRTDELSAGATDEGRQGRRKRAKLQNGELFGLPIPESLKYAGQGQNAPAAGSAGGGDNGVDDGDDSVAAAAGGATTSEDVRLNASEAARVRSAFGSAVEQSVLEWVTEEDKLAPYLTEVLECITLLSRLP